MNTIVDIKELGALSAKQPSRSILLIDGHVPHNASAKVYFFYSANLQESDAAPFGLARIAGYLDHFRIRHEIVRLRDFPSPEEIINLAAKFDIIGISGLTQSAPEMYKLCRMIKKAYPRKIIIGGREHFGLDYDWILKNRPVTGIDLCCTSQGELPLLALAYGIGQKKVGSIAFLDQHGEVQKNEYFPRLDEAAQEEILRPYPAKLLPLHWYTNIFPEFQKIFPFCGDALLGTGCPYACSFCANNSFLEDRRYVPTLKTVQKEILSLKELGTKFFFLRDLLVNANDAILRTFIDFMEGLGMKWACHMSIRHTKKDLFKKMAESGCLEIMAGMEDVMDDRACLKKGASNSTAIRFLEKAKKYMLVRCFLILGLPGHYNYPREEIKRKFLDFMKSYPQAIFRMAVWTPMIGTPDFESYKNMLTENPRQELKFLTGFNTLRYVIDPGKIFASLGLPAEKQWANDPLDWEILRDEIIREYYSSKEFKSFLNGLRGLKYQAAKEFQEVALQRLAM